MNEENKQIRSRVRGDLAAVDELATRRKHTVSKSKNLIGQTQKLISSNSTLGLLQRVKQIHGQEIWREERRANGHKFESFSEYCTTQQPFGLGVGQHNAWINAEALHGMLKGNSVIQKDLMEARVRTIKPLAKHGGARKKQGYNVTLPRGNSSTYLLAKMKRAALDGCPKAKTALDRLAKGEIKSVVKAAIASGVHKAPDSDANRPPLQAIQAGFRKRQISVPVDDAEGVMRRLLKHYTIEELTEAGRSVPKEDKHHHAKKPQRVKARTKGVRGYKNVMRGTKYGNPFSIAKYGRDGCLQKYRNWLLTTAEGEKVVALAKQELRGYDLGCTCPLDENCHADILLRVANDQPLIDEKSALEKP